MPDTRLRIGILGAARIARLFTDAVRPSTKVVVAAVASRDAARAQSFATELGIPRVHADYDALLADPAIDIVYNPLPNNLHAHWSIRAVAAGKHVLCEKPLAANEAEARAMFDAAQRRGVYLVEGYPYRAQPQTIKLAELVRARAIGNLQTVQATFGFPLNDLANIRYRPELAGGALMDAGSYPVSLVRMIAGERPRRVHAVARWAETGVDRTMVGTLDFASGLLAQVACSMGTARHRRVMLVGEAGILQSTWFNDTSPQMPPLVDIRRGIGYDAPHEVIELPAMPGFLAEAEAFHALVTGGWAHWPGATPAESIDIAAILDALAASARSGAAVDLAPAP